MSEPQLDWSQAEVKHRRLSVALAGEPPNGWKDTFQRTAQLLSKGEWEDVTLKKHSVRVDGLQPGSEEKLRFFLESVVQQANATHEPSEDASQDEADEAEEASDGSTEDDATMTERFRSFA